MKKIITYSAVMAIALASVSCVKENFDSVSEQQALKQITITVGAAEDATKSSLDGTKTISWEAGDQIGVWDGTALRVFTTTESGPAAKFTGEISETATELYAKYPYFSTDTWKDGVVTTSIPTVQTAVTGSFAKGANVSVGKVVISGADTTCTMKNVCSYFKFTLANGDRRVKSVTLSPHDGSDSYQMSGVVNITVSDSDPAASGTTGVNHYVTLKAEDASYLAAGTYYIALMPNTFSEGISLTFTSTDETTAFKRKNSDVEFKRNTPLDGGDISTAELNWLETQTIELNFADKNNPFNETINSDRNTAIVR